MSAGGVCGKHSLEQGVQLLKKQRACFKHLCLSKLNRALNPNLFDYNINREKLWL